MSRIETHDTAVRPRPAIASWPVWLDPSILDAAYDPAALFRTNREATVRAIHKAMHHEPTIDWLLANRGKVPHYFHQLAMDGQLG